METYFKINYEFDKQHVDDAIAQRVADGIADYICVADGVILNTANRRPDYLKVINGGMFAICDKRYKELQSQNLFVRGWGRLQKKWRFTSFALWDILCSPFWSVWQITWRKCHGYY